MTRIALNLFLAAAISYPPSSLAQATAESSSMQWANASALPGVKFSILGDVVADPWRPGGKTGAGRRDILDWQAEFSTASGGSTLKESVSLQPGQSGAGLLVGDFQEKERLADAAQVPPGHTILESGKILRAAVLRFPVGKTRQAQYPVFLVNADAEQRINISFGSTRYDLDYAVPQKIMVPTGERLRLKVTAAGLEREMAFTLESYHRGGILAFYRTEGADRTAFVFVNLKSMESLDEMLSASGGGTDSPPPESTP